MRKIFLWGTIVFFFFIFCAFCNVSLVILTSGLEIESTERRIAKMHTKIKTIAVLGINLWTFHLSTARPPVALCNTACCGLTITSHSMRC